MYSPRIYGKVRSGHCFGRQADEWLRTKVEDIGRARYILRSIVVAILLMGLWLLMSGVYKPLVIGFGALSVLLVVYIIRRMDRVDGDQVQVEISLARASLYFLWLMVEIAKSNWTVTKLILSSPMTLRQRLFRVPHSQRTDLAQVVFGNSITLTPGTITVEAETGRFLVHALDYQSEDDAALADMNSRVANIEKAAVS
jgi:multicomponent Na+:H+ antiporter subunit E